jgi:tRNA 5-methylaminomethyl-2-thiouridine biosynthesis bifunctional protein
MQFLKAEQLSQLTDFKIKNDGLYFPQGGWINPQDFCHAQLNHANIHVIPQTEITHIIKKEINWYIYTHEKKLIAQAPIVIVANSYAANQFNYFNTLPLQALQGQVTYPNETLKSQRLKTVICHEGYLTPSYQNLHSLGATYETNDQLNVSQANNHNNFEKLAEHCPNIAASFNENHIVASQARSSLRCSSLDHLPIIGFSPIYQAFKQDYQDIYLGKRWSQYPNLQPTGLYLNIAHGSRGVISTALAAEILAAQINNEPLPISADVLMALATQRFWIRQLKNK